MVRHERASAEEYKTRRCVDEQRRLPIGMPPNPTLRPRNDRRRLACHSALRTQLVILATLALAIAPVGGSESRFAPEPQIKAVYVLRFAQFVDWPDSSLGAKSDPFTIGVLGRSPFGDVLESTLRGRQARGRSLRLRAMTSGSDSDGVQMVYFGAMSRHDRQRALAQLRDKPLLTVGETRGFLDDGGAIAFVRVGNSVRFAVGLDATRRAHLNISARILQLAESVHGKP